MGEDADLSSRRAEFESLSEHCHTPVVRYGVVPYKDAAKQREYARLWIARRRAEYMADKACLDCGATEQLEIDHVDPTQKVSHRIWSWSAARRSAELAKCVVRCRECHLKRTVAQRSIPLIHGTANAYNKKACRCDECKAFQRERFRARRAGRGR